MQLRIPPGRAGRHWLLEWLESARRAADLLDHKRRELEFELQRVQAIAAQREHAWQQAAREAEAWLARLDTIGAERSIRFAVELDGRPTEVRLEWQQVMGVHYPTQHIVQFPPESPIHTLQGGAALVPARAAYRLAADAGVANAVAKTAVTRIRSDLVATVRRMRALRLRAIPAHESALHALELALDEKDREDAVAARWAAEREPPLTQGGGES